jgi:hypothetical protein
MKRFLLITWSLFFMAARGMEQEDPFLMSCKTLPLELFVAQKDEDIRNDKIMYSFGSVGSGWVMSYALRTISPVKATYESKTAEADLTPDQNVPILLDPQLWNQGTRWGLCLDSVNICDRFRINATSFRVETLFFEGINNNRLALVAQSNKKQHKFYVLHQSPDNAGTVQHHTYVQPIVFGDGELRSLLLHREINRCVGGIKNAYTNIAMPHAIAIGDIHKKEDRSIDCGVPLETEDGHLSLLTLPAEDRYECIASLATNFVLRKAIYLGKNTYLGLTDEGDIISFWLNDGQLIEYAQQKCGGKKFKDIDVDETVKTESGFMPRIGLLACNGDVYLSDLCKGEKPILLYTRTLEEPDSIHRFFYDKGQCAVAYKDGNSYDTFHVWPDGFNLALACVYLRKSLHQSNEDEKR